MKPRSYSGGQTSPSLSLTLICIPEKAGSTPVTGRRTLKSSKREFKLYNIDEHRSVMFDPIKVFRQRDNLYSKRELKETALLQTVLKGQESPSAKVIHLS